MRFSKYRRDEDGGMTLIGHVAEFMELTTDDEEPRVNGLRLVAFCGERGRPSDAIELYAEADGEPCVECKTEYAQRTGAQ